MLPVHFTPKLFSLLKAGYSRATFKDDVLAGLTVAIVALPLSMALGIASGASPDKGLITAVVAGFFISLLGGSRVQIGGPTGAFIVVVFNVIAAHGYGGLVTATMMAGLILMVAGYARLGQVIRYIPYPVVTGFTAGIAVIIATSQIKDFLGLQIDNVPADFIEKWSVYLEHMDSFDQTTFVVGMCSLFLIMMMRRYVPKLPGYLMAIFVTGGVVLAFHLPVETIGQRFPDMPTGLPMPSMSVPDWSLIAELIPSAFTIAFLAGIESLLSAMVADGMTGYKHRSSQELVGQGVANIASAFFGGMPATGAIARTATNIKSGGKTPVAGISHAVFVLLFMMFASDVMAYVPLVTLAAILFVVAWNMSEIHHFIHIFRLSKNDRIVMLLTFGLTVMVDLTVAIAIGVSLASLLFMKQMSQSAVLHAQGRHIRDEFGDNVMEIEHQRDDLPEGAEVFRFTGPIFFAVAGTMLDALHGMGETPKVLIVRMKLVPYMDVSGLNAIRDVLKECCDKDMKVILTGLQKQPGDMLKRAGIVEDQETLWMSLSYDNSIKLARDLIQNR